MQVGTLREGVQVACTREAAGPIGRVDGGASHVSAPRRARVRVRVHWRRDLTGALNKGTDRGVCNARIGHVDGAARAVSRLLVLDVRLIGNVLLRSGKVLALLHGTVHVVPAPDVVRVADQLCPGVLLGLVVAHVVKTVDGTATTQHLTTRPLGHATGLAVRASKTRLGSGVPAPVVLGSHRAVVQVRGRRQKHVVVIVARLASLDHSHIQRRVLGKARGHHETRLATADDDVVERLAINVLGLARKRTTDRSRRRGREIIRAYKESADHKCQSDTRLAQQHRALSGMSEVES